MAKGDWLCRADGKARRSSNAIKMAKMRRVKPAVDQITKAVSVEDQAALLRAVAGHRNLAAACRVAGINSSLNDTDADTVNYLCGQSARMLGRARSNETATSRDKQDAIQTTLMMMGPSPNKIGDVPSIRKRAQLLGIPSTKFFRSEKAMMDKRGSLTAKEEGVYWARCKKKKGHRKIDDNLHHLLLAAFYDHPHAIISPNSKDTIMVRNKQVRKIMLMVGLSTIFSDIVHANPIIKSRVGERAFRYIISALRCVRRFTNSHKTMCGCTLCVGLQMMHRSLQAKQGVIKCRIAIDMQSRTRKARAEEMSRGWGDPGLHPTPSHAIRAGTCPRWTAHTVPHWKCQTHQCSECSDYPVPPEEAREDADADAEYISFHVYEIKESERKDGKVRQRLEVVQKKTKIGEFHRLSPLLQTSTTKRKISHDELQAGCSLLEGAA